MTSFYLLYTQYYEIMSNVYILLSVRSWAISLPFFEISSSHFRCKLIWPSPWRLAKWLLIETALTVNFMPEHSLSSKNRNLTISTWSLDSWSLLCFYIIVNMNIVSIWQSLRRSYQEFLSGDPAIRPWDDSRCRNRRPTKKKIIATLQVQINN